MSNFNIYKRKDGRFEGRVYTIFEGKRSYRSFYGKTCEEVEKKISALFPAEALTEITVKQLLDEWLSSKFNRIKKSTSANYQMKLNKHILPYFFNMTCNELSAAQVNDFINVKISEGLSLRYISDMIVILKSAFRYASRAFRIINPLDGFSFSKPQVSQIHYFAQLHGRPEGCL